ncbi:MAG: 3-dehydroquinate synthase [Gammaproteobacteria bacterium]
MTAAEKILVRHGGGEYPVFCGGDFCDENAVRAFCAAGKIAAVADENVRKHWREDVIPFAKIEIPSGEEHKTLRTAEMILDRLAELKMRRDGTVVAFGGGVAGDVAGFAAAVYMRGVRLIQIPTTLLAQVDAAIGGKTGVNRARGKNLIGAFYPPAAVFCDSRFLSTLPPREYRAGLAEVVKYAMLGDAEFFVWLEENAARLLNLDGDAVREAVVRSARMKAQIVSEDEREKSGRRALLNLGHTFAHGLENAAGYGVFLHGEAVAAGLVAAAKLSVKLNTGFPAADVGRVIALLKQFRLPVSFSGIDAEEIHRATGMDKKFTAAETRFVLMEQIGAARLREVSADDKVREVLEEMR